MADGSGAIVERLIVQWDADTAKINAKLDKMLAKHKEIAGDIGKIDFGKSFTRVFDSARLGVLEEGSAKLRIFGSALEPLGPLGIGAAAGIAAFGFAVEEAIKTAEWAENLERTAKGLGLTTTALQEFDHVATATGIPIEKMRESLAGLEKTIGLVESGLARAMTVKVFTEGLKITPEQLRGWGTLEAQLPHILDAAAKLNVEERNGLASRLKVDPEVLNSLVAARHRLTELIAEAHRYGVVIDEDVIKRSAEAGEKLKFAADIIDKNLKGAFADLAPSIASATLELAKFLHLMLAVPQKSTDAAWKGAIWEALGVVTGQGFGGGANAQYRDVARQRGSLMQHFSVADMMDRLDQGVAPTQLAGAKGAKGAKGSKFDITKADLDAIAAAYKAELQARLGIVSDADARHAIETQLLNIEIDKKKADADREVLDGKKGQVAADTVKTLLERERGERQALIDRQAEWADEDAHDKVLQAQFDADRAILEAKIKMTPNVEERQKLEEDLLQITQAHDNYMREQALGREVVLGQTTQLNADHIIKEAKTADDADRKAKLYLDTYGPIRDALSAAVHGGWPGLAKYMGDKLKENLIDALANALTSGVLNGAFGGKGGGGIGSILSFGASLFGFADGTDSAPGGLSWVGERGPELMNVPRGASITPHGASMAMMRGGLGGGGGGGVTYMHVQVDAKDAVLSQTVAGWIVQGIAVAAPSIRQAAVSDTMTRMSRNAYNTIR